MALITGNGMGCRTDLHGGRICSETCFSAFLPVTGSGGQRGNQLSMKKRNGKKKNGASAICCFSGCFHPQEYCSFPLHSVCSLTFVTPPLVWLRTTFLWRAASTHFQDL